MSYPDDVVLLLDVMYKSLALTDILALCSHKLPLGSVKSTDYTLHLQSAQTGFKMKWAVFQFEVFAIQCTVQLPTNRKLPNCIMAT